MWNFRNLSLILVLTFLLTTIYIKQISDETDDKTETGNGVTKNVIAYSLMKTIEMESRSFECDENRRTHRSETHFENNKWTKIDGTDFYVYSIHEDYRLSPYDYVRILGMAKENWNQTLYCNSITSDGHYKSTKSTKIPIWSENWRDTNEQNFKPFLISCPLQTELYLSKNPCEFHGKSIISTKKFRRKPKRTVAICVKPLDFKTDISKHLIQWIEINKILGATSFQFYIRRVHPSVMAVLKWYGFKLVYFANLQQRKNIWQKRKDEILIYNSCFYDNLDSEYVLPIDIDEIIVPRHRTTWSGIFDWFEPNFASYSARNAFYLNGNRSVFFMGTFERTKFSDAGESGKSFVKTANALTVFNHYALHVLKPGIGRCHFIPENSAQMNHYRRDCPQDLLPECAKYVSSPRVYDDIVLKYKKVFDFNYNRILEKIKYVY